jgi:cysteinyl-tRNA synthetase
MTQPTWKVPVAVNPPEELSFYNSLTRQKNLFVPVNGGRNVYWYICGPTVYDSAHMGHARYVGHSPGV